VHEQQNHCKHQAIQVGPVLANNLASTFTVATKGSSKANAAARLAKAQPQKQATAAATPAPTLIAAGSNYGHCWRLFLQLWHVRVAP
jgi:hypothetical protein